MKVAILSVQVPFIKGGAEVLAETCKTALIKRNISAEIVTIPFKWYPPEKILDHIEMAKLIDLSEVNGEKIDKVICLKFPAYFCQHKNKTLWLLHQHRQAYDLYNTSYGDLKLTKSGQKIAKKIKQLDNKLIPQHQGIYTISQNIANKLKHYNDITADEVLYPPPQNAELFSCNDYADFILYPSRFSEIKRQDLIVRAMKLVKGKLKLILVGDYDNSYGLYVRQLIEELNLQEKIILKNYITEDEKLKLYSTCLAVYNGVYDEDYGYVTIEGFLSSKPVIVHSDSGGPLEFVINNTNGFITSPTPEAIAEVLNEISINKNKAMVYGKNAHETLKQKKICWNYTIERLLA